ncbi:MAG: M1 family metallopeptidase [Bacteroidetes bacterium]|nr:M1 family metallopeptidase [Bacteroidota bacterium]
MVNYINIRSCTVLIGLCVLCACGSSKRASKKAVDLETITVSAKNNPMNIYRAAATKEWEIVHTTVLLKFNFKEKTADGEVGLTLHPYFYATDSIVLDAKSMKIESVKLSHSEDGKPLAFQYTDDKLKLKFKKTYSRKDTIGLIIKYKAMPYEGKKGGSNAINDDRGLYFINTDNAIANKPVQIWTQGETESNSHWVPTIDKPNQRTTLALLLQVPDSMTTLSNGYLDKERSTLSIDDGVRMRSDFWIMDKPIQVYAMMFAIGKFSIVNDDNVLGKPVNYYVEPEYAPYAKAMFKHTPEMVEHFSKITGVPYPWNKYSQIVVRDYVSGAMENTTATLCGEFMNQNLRENKDNDYEDVVSHELFHQWFGDYVTAESWSNLTLNESFATYGEQLWRKYKYGKPYADELAWNDLNIYLSAGAAASPLVRYYYSDKEDMFDRISYQKGGAILHYLHGLLGDEAFYKSMQTYLTKNALHPAEASDWRKAIEEVTGEDWNWFFNQWYYKGGHPQLDIKYTYDEVAKKLNINATQKQEGAAYRLPVKIGVAYGANKTIKDWTINEKKDVLSIPYENGTKPTIIFDTEHWIVGEVNEDKTATEWLNTFKSSDSDAVTKFRALNSIKKKYDDASNTEMINLALQDKTKSVRNKALQMLMPITTQSLQDKWKRDVAYMAANDVNNNVRATAFKVLGNWVVKSSKPDMLAALSDSSYAVAGSALAALAELQPDTVYGIAIKMLDTDPKGELESSIWDVIADEGKESDVKLFEERVPHYYGTKKIYLASSMSEYLKNAKSEKAFDRTLELYTQMTKSEVIQGYRVSIAAYLIYAASDYKKKKKEARNNPDMNNAELRYNKLSLAIEDVIKSETDEDNKKTLRNYKAMLDR